MNDIDFINFMGETIFHSLKRNEFIDCSDTPETRKAADDFIQTGKCENINDLTNILKSPSDPKTKYDAVCAFYEYVKNYPASSYKAAKFDFYFISSKRSTLIKCKAFKLNITQNNAIDICYNALLDRMVNIREKISEQIRAKKSKIKE